MQFRPQEIGFEDNLMDMMPWEELLDINVFQEDMSVDQTYVWNDKFSFNGSEPTDFTGPLSTAAHMDEIADQGSATVQYLRIVSEHADDHFHVHMTYLDQDNA